MNVLKIEEFPFVEFGAGIKRKVRLVASPYTNGGNELSIVSVNIPPHGISEGHVHEDVDEYIYFENPGVAVIDGEEMPVGKGEIVHARRGRLHECRNTSDTMELTLLCIFSPALKPYGKYPELIEKTNAFLDGKR